MPLHLLYLPIQRHTTLRNCAARCAPGLVTPKLELSRAGVDAVMSVLEMHNARSTDDMDQAIIDFEPGVRVLIEANPLKEGCTVTLKVVTPAVLRFLIDMLHAADWLLMLPPPMMHVLSVKPAMFGEVHTTRCKDETTLASILLGTW